MKSEQGTCPHSDGWSEDQHQCVNLLHNIAHDGTHECGKYTEIQTLEKGSPYPMFGSGCSSTLFNVSRDRIITTLSEKGRV